MPPMWAGGGLPRGSLLYKKAAEEEVGEPGVRTCKKKSCHTKDGVVIMYQFGYCWDLDVVAFEIKIPPFQFVWQWRACQGLPPAIGANYVRSRTKRISWSNDIVRDSFLERCCCLQYFVDVIFYSWQKGDNVDDSSSSSKSSNSNDDTQKIRRMWKQPR